jgi:hypothetical protein
MVKRSSFSFRPGVRSALLILLAALVLAGCAPKAVVSVSPAFNPVPDQEVIQVLPFVATLVPDAITDTVFNDFVDKLNDSRNGSGVQWFVILKQEVQEVDPVWLAKQVYLSGELWSYVENSGCCSTEMRIKGRVRLFEPGRPQPTFEVAVPLESFFEHDRSTLADERAKLARRLAREMAEQVLAALRAKAPKNP